MSVFPFFSRDFRGSAGIKNPCFFGGFPGHFPKKQGKEGQGWGPPQFQEKRSRRERAILGALGEFRGILGAALGIGNSILGIRNSILGMVSHDLTNTKPTILGATLGAIPGIAANPPERFSFAPAFSERFFKNWGGPRAPEKLTPHCLAAIFDSQLPSPKLSLKIPPKLPLPLNRGHFFLFQNYPRGKGNCAAIERQKLSRGNFCLAASRCLSGPSG